MGKMKWLILGAVLGLVAIQPRDAHAGTMECLAIQNPDSRAWCLAMNSKSIMDCLAIQNPDLRNFCTAVINSNRNDCLGIQNADLRAQCFASL